MLVRIRSAHKPVAHRQPSIYRHSRVRTYPTVPRATGSIAIYRTARQQSLFPVHNTVSGCWSVRLYATKKRGSKPTFQLKKDAEDVVEAEEEQAYIPEGTIPKQDEKLRTEKLTPREFAQRDPMGRIKVIDEGRKTEAEKLREKYRPQKPSRLSRFWKTVKEASIQALRDSPFGMFMPKPPPPPPEPTPLEFYEFQPDLHEAKKQQMEREKREKEVINKFLAAARLAKFEEYQQRGPTTLPPSKLIHMTRVWRAAMKQQQWDVARDALNVCVRSEYYSRGELSMLLAMKATCAYEMGMPHWALSDLANAILADPSNTNLFLIMGDIYKSLHLYPEARKRYTQALQFKVAGAEARLKALQEAEQAWPTEIDSKVKKYADKIDPEEWPKYRKQLMDVVRGTFPRKWVEPVPAVADMPDAFKKLIMEGECIEVRDTLTPRGRGLYVTRDFAPGEEIFVDEALISTTLSETRCDFCQKPLKVSTKIDCPSCGNESYCDPICRGEAATRYHDYTCGTHDLDIRSYGREQSGMHSQLRAVYASLALKVIGMTMKRPEYPCSTFEIPFWRMLGSKYTEPLKDLERIHLATLPAYYSGVLHPLLHKNAVIFDFEWFDRLVGKFMANVISMTCKSPTGDLEYVYGLFPRASFINHSCEPNAIIAYDVNEQGHVLSVIATKPIKKDEEVFISYVPVDAEFADRTSYLLNQYGFSCMCARCMKERPSKPEEAPSEIQYLWNQLVKAGLGIERKESPFHDRL